jgi:hypothetical protein
VGSDENPGPFTIEMLDKRYVSREICALQVRTMSEKLVESQEAIEGINNKITATLVFVIITLVAIITAAIKGLL